MKSTISNDKGTQYSDPASVNIYIGKITAAL